MLTSGQQDNKTLDEHLFFASFLAGGFVLALATYLSPLRNIFLSDFGLFANLSVLFYLLAFGYGLKGISAVNMENWKSWRPLAIVTVLALFMAAEELRWGLPFVLEDTAGWPVQRVRDLASLSLIGIPDGSGLLVSGLVAGARLAIILVVLYALGAAIYFREKLPALWVTWKQRKFFLYAACFAVFVLLMVFLKAGFLPGAVLLTGFTRMAASLSFLMLVLQLRPKAPV